MKQTEKQFEKFQAVMKKKYQYWFPWQATEKKISNVLIIANSTHAMLCSPGCGHAKNVHSHFFLSYRNPHIITRKKSEIY